MGRVRMDIFIFLKICKFWNITKKQSGNAEGRQIADTIVTKTENRI